MQSALDHLKIFWERASRVGVTGNRDFNPGWHTALDLKNLLTVSEAITRAALERKESRGAQFREDYPEKDEQLRENEHHDSKGGRRYDGSSAGAVAGDAGLFEADHRGDEVSGQKQRPSESGAAMSKAASSAISRPAFPREWSCSMRLITFRRRRRTTSQLDGTARQANAVRVQPKSMACRS